MRATFVPTQPSIMLLGKATKPSSPPCYIIARTWKSRIRGKEPPETLLSREHRVELLRRCSEVGLSVDRRLMLSLNVSVKADYLSLSKARLHAWARRSPLQKYSNLAQATSTGVSTFQLHRSCMARQGLMTSFSKSDQGRFKGNHLYLPGYMYQRTT